MDPNNSNILYASMWEFRRGPWFFESGGENSALLNRLRGERHGIKFIMVFPKGD
ncbi:MAG: hypothetical protein CM15mP102_15150 [Flavobacteriales bacterium]|nr:MAG: hypothetical protein CM15mP102_15150 [Flavobacteriales bacterium]